MKTYDVNINTLGGDGHVSEIVIAENLFAAAIVVLEKLKNETEMSPAMASLKKVKNQWPEHAMQFELRCFERRGAFIVQEKP